MVEALPYYFHLISNEVYSLIPLSKILDLEADDLSLHISSDAQLKTTKTGEDDLSLHILSDIELKTTKTGEDDLSLIV